MESFHGGEVADGLHLASKGDDGHLDALAGQRVFHQFIPKDLQPEVERIDGLPGHRLGGVEKQDARTARLGIVREFQAGIE